MADGRKRPGPPEDSSSSRTKKRLSLPNYPDTRRRNMKKAIAGVLVVLDVPDTREGLLSPDCTNLLGLGAFLCGLRGMFTHACCVTTRVTAGVGVGSLALWLGLQKSGKRKQTTPRSRQECKRFFMEILEKNRKFRKFTSSIRTALRPRKISPICTPSLPLPIGRVPL